MDVLLVMVELTVIMLIVSTLLYSTYAYIRRYRRTIITKYKIQPYGCGEELSRDQVSVGSRNLYWSITYNVFRKLYQLLRDKIHTGILDDWFVLMVLFLFLITITFIALSLIGVFG